MECPHRLYLSKGEHPVYIDNCKVPHHLEGIRFLYRLFKKNKPGAILNDPAGFNKEVQIVLFLKAVCHLLDKTILILCPEGTEHEWLQLFETWTDLGDDVAIETAKPYLKKKVMINGMVNLPPFSQQAWSILVVTDDSPPNIVLRYTFKSDFRIWNTSINIKKNLGIFPSIYAWLNQDKTKSKNTMDKFHISDFTADKNNVRDVVDKAVLLDAFMEDIVIRRNKIDCNFEEQQSHPTPKISIKNKDATGTKIKRSKRKIKDSEFSLIKSIESTVPKLPKPSDVNKDITLPTSEYDPVSDDNLQEVDEFNMNTVISQDSNIQLVYETDTMTENDEIYEMDTQVVASIGDNNEILHNNEMECNVQEEPNSNELNEILNTNNANWRVTDIEIQDEHIQSPKEISDEAIEVKYKMEESDAIHSIEELVTEIAENQSIIESETSNKFKSDNDITDANNELTEQDNERKESGDGKGSADLDEIDIKNNQFKEQAMKRFKGTILDSIF